MALLRLAGFKAVRVTSFWTPGLSEPTPHEAMVLANVGRRPQCRVSGLRLGLQRGLAHDAADAPRREGVRELRGRDRARQPGLPRRDRRQRAEPEPLLDAAVRPARPRRPPAPAYLQLLAASYDALKEAAPDVRVWGGALAPRGVDRPNTGRDTLSPTRFLRELGRPTARAAGRSRSWTASRSIPTRSTRASPSTRSRDRDHLGLIDQDVLVRLLGKAFDGTARSARGCRSSTTSSGSSRRSRRRSARSTAASSRRRRARLRGGAGGGVPACDPARLLPVERRRDAPLPHPRRAPAAWLAVRPRLRRRDAEDVARARPGGDGVGRTGRSALPGGTEGVGRLRHDQTYDLAPMRARLHLPGPARCACRGGRRSRRQRRGRGRPARQFPRARGHARLVPALVSLRRRGAARAPRRAGRARPSCCGLLAAAPLPAAEATAGSPRASGWSGRRPRPARRPALGAAAGGRLPRRRDHELLGAGLTAPAAEEIAALRSVVERAATPASSSPSTTRARRRRR